jgi:hypothetical protein
VTPDPIGISPDLTVEGSFAAMNELLPIAMGLILGGTFALRSRFFRPIWVQGTAVVLAGILATIVSGEYRETAALVIVDIGEVLLAAWIVSFLLERFVFRRAAHGSLRHAGVPTKSPLSKTS